MSAMNVSLGSKLVWHMYSKPNAKWCKILQSKYLDCVSPTRIFAISNPPAALAIWNLLLLCRKVINPYITWEINNGDEALFWRDSWNRYPALSTVPKLQMVTNLANARWGNGVKYYIQSIDALTSKVIWNGFSSLPISMQQKEFISKILSARMVYFPEYVDKILWNPSKSRNYTVKLGYKAVMSNGACCNP